MQRLGTASCWRVLALLGLVGLSACAAAASGWEPALGPGGWQDPAAIVENADGCRG